MELRHLRYFIRAAELLHFTRAAESLFISQPTLSIHIQQLEEELGTELFARVGRNVRLTEAGELLLLRARQAVNELEIAAEEIGALVGLMRGTLRIAGLPSFSSHVLAPWIAAFNSIHPDVLIKARPGSSEEIEAGILAGDLDLGFVILPIEHDELIVTRLYTDNLVAIVSEEHRLAGKSKLEPQDLRSLPVATASQRMVLGRLQRKYFEEQELTPKIIVESDDGHSLIEMAKLGELMTFLPETVVKHDPRIRILRLPGPGMQLEFAAICAHETPASKAFIVIASEGAKFFQGVL